MSSEENSLKKSEEAFWRELMVQYWYFVVIFGVVIIGAIIGFLLIIDSYVKTSTIGGQGTWTFNQFSMGTLLEFIIFLVLQILVFDIIPVLIIIGILVGILWYGVFSPEVKEELKSRSKEDDEDKKRFGKGSEGGGAFGFFMFIGVCIYVWFDGNWLTEFGDLSVRYFVDAWIAVFLWALLIGAIFIIIGMAWFINKYKE